MIPTSATIASSIAIRLRYLAGRLHALGPRSIYEIMCEIVGGADPMQRLETYARLDADFIREHGGDVLPPPVRRIK
jgi:hypothetical protein